MTALRSQSEVEEITEQHLLSIIDREATQLLGMNGAEFARRWHSGEFASNSDPRVTQVAMLLPDAR